MQVNGTNPPGDTTPAILLSASAAAGQKDIFIGNNVVAPGTYFFLQDVAKMETPPVGLPRIIGGELVRVAAQSGGSPNKVTLEQNLTQNYTTSTTTGLTPVPSGVSVVRNLKIVGLRLRGLNQTGFGPWFYAGWTDGLQLINCSGNRGSAVGFGVFYSRSATVTNCRGNDLPRFLGAVGWGYTFQVQRTVASTFNRLFATNAQYSMTLEAGSSGIVVNSLAYVQLYFDVGTQNLYGAQSSFDIHGGEAYDVIVNGAFAPLSDLSLGNTSWRRGASKVTLNHCYFRTARIVTCIADSTLNGCYGQQVKFEYANPPQVDINNGARLSNIENFTIDGCSLTWPASSDGVPVISGGPNNPSPTNFIIDRLKVKNTRVENLFGGASIRLDLNTKDNAVISAMEISDCTLLNNSPSIVGHVIVTNNAQTPTPTSLTMTVTNTKFVQATSVLYVAYGLSTPSTTRFVNGGGNQRGTTLGSLGAFSCAADVNNMSKQGPGC